MLDKRIVFLCSKEQKKEWLEAAKSSEISLGEFIRAAIEKELKNERTKMD